MNYTTAQTLLKQWIEIIDASERRSKENAHKSLNGLDGRIRRTTGQPVIFDFDTYQDQQKIQNLLCQELPHLANIIRSQPEIMDGYQWTRKDFIELYSEHFRLVVGKLQKIIDQATNV